MARQLKYTIPFVSLTEVAYEVRIYVEGWTGAATQLTGGSSPFSTEEAGEDWMLPIAMQTGYLRVACEESEWRNLVPTSPTSHFVTLVKRGGSLPVWQGYIQYSTYTHSLYCGTDVYEFPLCSALSLLEDERLTWTPNRRTFASLIADILGMVNDDTQWSAVYFPENISGDNSIDLASAVSLLPFFDVEERTVWEEFFSYTEEYYEPAKTCLEMLEEICKFWGWTLHEVGTALYFCATDESVGWRVTTLEELAELNSSTILETVAQPSEDYAQLEWMSDDHDVSINNPVQTITIEGDLDGDEDIIEVDIAKIAQFANLPNQVTLGNGTYYAQCLGLTKFDDWRNGGVITTYRGAEGTNWQTRDRLIPQHMEFLYGPVFRKSDTWEQSADASKTKYNWTHDIFMGVVRDSDEDTAGYATLQFVSLNEYVLSDCALVIASKVQCDTGMTATTSHLEMMVTVGNYHWDGSQWVQHGTEWRGAFFRVYVGDDANRSQSTQDGKIVTTLNYRTPYQGADGYGMPVTIPMRGQVAITLRWMQYTPFYVISTQIWPIVYRLTDLKVKLVPSVNAVTGVQPQDHNTYKADGAGTGEETVTISFLTKNNNLAAPKLITIDDEWLTTMQWNDGETERPEDHLLSRLSRLKGASATEWRDIDIDNDDATSIAPYQDGGTRLLPVRVRREWGEGSAHVLLGKVL